MVDLEASGVSAATAQRMAKLGNPTLWFASYDPVPYSAWVAIEAWDGAHWIDMEEFMRRRGMTPETDEPVPRP